MANDQTVTLYDAIDIFIDTYESALSRFRPSSLVSHMRTAQHGGTFDFPDWCADLFDWYDRLFEATEGAIDPCVGEDLIRLGYDAHYSFTVAPDALGYDTGGAASDTAPSRNTASGTANESHLGNTPYESHLGAIHGRPTWRNDVERHGERGTTLVTHGPVALDFGACGKGYAVDLIAGMLAPHTDAFVIDAGGDLLIRMDAGSPITIALEDPADPTRAVGTAELNAGAFCASAPSRRHWGEAAGHQLHHLLNAIDGLPVEDVAATWVAVARNTGLVTTPIGQHSNALSNASGFGITMDHSAQSTGSGKPLSHAHHANPTAIADGLATALFTTSAEQLRRYFDFDCAILNADRTAAQSPNFPGSFFTR
ncbi:FAD:protein FMN transferase [Bifidobacterium colobi]